MSSARAAARRRLLQGSFSTESTQKSNATSAPSDAVIAVATRQLEKSFSAYCSAALALEMVQPATVERMTRELEHLKSGPVSERHDKLLELLMRSLRGCRVRVTEQRMSGCEGIVLHGDRGDEGKLPVKLTMHDGSIQEVSLRPIHLQLIQGRREAEEQEAAEAAAAEAAEQAERMRRLTCTQQPHVMANELSAELKGKSFRELRLMAEKLDALELLNNPLVQYDRAACREGESLGTRKGRALCACAVNAALTSPK